MPNFPCLRPCITCSLQRSLVGHQHCYIIRLFHTVYPHWNTIQLPWKSGNTPNIFVSKVCLDHVAINMFWPVSSLFYLRCRKNTLFFQPCNSLKNTKATVENNTFPSSMKWLCHTKQQPNSLPKNRILLCSTFGWPILTLHKLHPVKNTRNTTTNCVILVPNG